ncbi:minor capsid protein [Streptococcus sp. UMB1203]|uniref:phage tail terminator protein n=1 Tax=Streptococcus sp. UMB1203 TaxID=3046327 RepID=UPI00255731C4|nr:minor capsid protein [Streptococcus sp. UMB1203]MDK7203621.1 minor capsid protein [Streptococcus sp. UMB1203]
MITLAEVRDWIKTFNAANNYYIGKIDNKQENSIGIYQRKTIDGPRVAIGGRTLASYDVKSISILIHWNKNANETEKRAQYLYNRLFEAELVVIGGIPVKMIALLQNEPVDVGTDDNNVYERVIELDLYYEREREGN